MASDDVTHGTGTGTVRIDVWIWSVRLTKTRAQAAAACKAGHVRVGGERVKPAHALK
ncbi:S4 domain-containing protein, partial [Streptomyces chryseus]